MANILAQNRIAYQIDRMYEGLVPEIEEEIISNAPVTRVNWSCDNLPEGLTLSSSGVLSGRPTTAGTYACNFSVETNWSIATKTINIIVQ